MKPLPTANDGYGFHGELLHILRNYGDGAPPEYSPAETAAIDLLWNAASKVVAKHMTGATPEKVRDFLDSKNGRHFFDSITHYMPRFGEGEKKLKLTARLVADAMEKSINANKWVRKVMAEGRTTMDNITLAVFETEEDGELPFHGELVIEADETEDGTAVTLDEADIMEDVVIEAFENAISEAVAEDPNAHLSVLRELDAALDEGDYESAQEIGLKLLQDCGVDESRIEEFKKGFKVTSGQRARISRKRMRPKSGGQLAKLRQRRRVARRGTSRMKRARYYKQNRRRISRRRAQLQNSVDLDAGLVVEMTSMGMRFVVVTEGQDPVFATDHATALELAEGDESRVLQLTAEVIDEAKRKSKSKKGKSSKADYDDSTDSYPGGPNGPAEAQVDDEDDEDDEEPSDDEGEDEEDETDDDKEADDEEDSDDEDEDDEEETDESVSAAVDDVLDESAESKLANEIAKFLKQHRDVGYGELATRFKIGRDVAQQAVIIAGRVAGAKGDEGSWLFLAKEIMGKLMKHSAGKEGPTSHSLPRKNHRTGVAASLDEPGANIVESAEANRVLDNAGVTNESLRKRIMIEMRMAADEGEFYDAVANIRLKGGDKAKMREVSLALQKADFYQKFHEAIEQDGDAVDEAGTQGTNPKKVGAGNKSGTVRVTKQALPKAKLQGKTGAIKSAHGTQAEADEPDYDQDVDDPDVDETVDKNGGSQTHTMGKGRTKPAAVGAKTLKKPAKLKHEGDEDDTDEDLAEVTAPESKAQALIAAATANGLDSETPLKIQDGVITLVVPRAKADAIRQAISA